MLTTADQMPPTSIRVTTGRVNMPLRGSRGLRRMRSGSFGSTARASAGSPSVTRFTIRSWTAVRGRGTPARVATATRSISPMLDESRYIRYFLMLPKIPRPSSTAATMEAKLSSVRVIAAASLVTSVPGDAHGDTDVGLLQGGCVIHPVPRHRHDVTVLLEGVDHAQLVCRGNPRIDLDALRLHARAGRRPWRPGPRRRRSCPW